MPNKDTKSRILQVHKILVEETDAEHYITIQQIIDRLADVGISAYRQTILSDIEQLIDAGVDIRCVKSSQNRYFIENGLFSFAELRLLVDAVEASQFITRHKSSVLIDKLCSLTSKYNNDKLSQELNNTDISIFRDGKGKLKIKIDDGTEQKQLTMNFSPKVRLERVLQERLGYSQVKAVEAANRLASKMTDEQLGYYLSESRQLEQMAHYEKNIRSADDNVLLENFSFAKMQFQEDDPMRLTVTDERGHFVVISEKNRDRAAIEQDIRQHLKVTDTETVTAIMDKAERLGFVEEPKQVQFKEYQIERDTQSSFTVRGGSTVIRLDLNDRDTARKRLRDTFGMSEAKADRIIGKAQKQSLANNLLTRAKAKVKQTADTLKNKKRERGSRK